MMFAYPALILTCVLSGQTPAPAADQAPPPAEQPAEKPANKPANEALSESSPAPATAQPAPAGAAQTPTPAPESSPPAAPQPPDDTTSTPAPAPAPAAAAPETTPAPAPAAKPKKRLLVLNLVDKGAGPEITQALTDAVSKQATDSYIGEVVTPKDLETEVQRAELQQMAGCDSDNCAFSLGTLVDAERVLAGNVAKVGADYLITILVIDVGSGKRENFQQRKVPAFNELYFYAAKQLTAIALTGQSVDYAVPVRLEFSEDVDPKILVDGKEGQVQGSLVMLDPGSHEIKVEAPGYETWKTSIDVKEGQPMSLRVEFVSSRIPLWPVTITLVGVGAVFGAFANVFAVAAHGRYGDWHDTPAGAIFALPIGVGADGSFGQPLFAADGTYLTKPASAAFLQARGSEVFLFAFLADALMVTSALTAVAAGAVLTADVVWFALAE